MSDSKLTIREPGNGLYGAFFIECDDKTLVAKFTTAKGGPDAVFFVLRDHNVSHRASHEDKQRAMSTIESILSNEEKKRFSTILSRLRAKAKKTKALLPILIEMTIY